MNGRTTQETPTPSPRESNKQLHLASGCFDGIRDVQSGGFGGGKATWNQMNAWTNGRPFHRVYHILQTLRQFHCGAPAIIVDSVSFVQST